MKLLKYTTVLFLFLAAFTMLNAQKFYVRANTGFAWGAQKIPVMESSYISDFSNPQKFTASDVSSSLGQGIQTNFCLGMFIDKNFFVEAGIRFWNSATIKSADEAHVYYYPDSSIAHYYFDKKLGAKNKYATISLGYQFNVFKKLDFYVKTGLMIGKSNIFLTQQARNTVHDTTDVFDYAYGYNEKIGVGFTMGSGVSYKLNNHFSLMGGLSVQFLNVKISQRNMTSYKVNGQDKLNDRRTGDKTTNYFSGNPKKSMDASPLQQPNPLIAPLGSCGLNIGVTYNF